MFKDFTQRFKHLGFRFRSRKSKFSEIYEKNGFAGEYYPLSGIGSSLEQTRNLREKLPELFKQYNIQCLVDAPCGDFFWMQSVGLHGIQYIGLDIVNSVIENNVRNYSRNNIQFKQLDIVSQIPPRADLIFCRDCFVHLSNCDILKALANFEKSESRYLLTTTFILRDKNDNLVSGRGWRPINLQKPPFNMPSPLFLLDEGCTESDGIYADKALGLWDITDIPCR